MADPDVETDRYDKAARYAIGHGYELRVKPVTSVVCHSTSNSIKNTSFASEAKYLFETPLVSAHYLIGKDGAIVRFLDPRRYVAWHAGNAQPDWVNAKSCGIELHHSVGDPPYPKAQLDALSALLHSLMALFTIPVDKIETHGQIAIAGPYLRKHDPDAWLHADFLEWRTHLAPAPAPPVPPSPLKRYIVRGLPVYQAAARAGALWGHLQAGDLVVIDNPANGHLADGRGFVRLDPDTMEPI